MKKEDRDEGKGGRKRCRGQEEGSMRIGGRGAGEEK